MTFRLCKACKNDAAPLAAVNEPPLNARPIVLSALVSYTRVVSMISKMYRLRERLVINLE